jgi:hypothetical protein
VDYDVIWSVLDVEAGNLKKSVLAILATEFPNRRGTTMKQSAV